MNKKFLYFAPILVLLGSILIIMGEKKPVFSLLLSGIIVVLAIIMTIIIVRDLIKISKNKK